MTTSFPIVIKDYLPEKKIESFKQYRLKGLSQHESNTTDFPYEFSPLTRREYNHESQLLRKEFRNHPIIIQTFICDHHLKINLRIFIEYVSKSKIVHRDLAT